MQLTYDHCKQKDGKKYHCNIVECTTRKLKDYIFADTQQIISNRQAANHTAKNGQTNMTWRSCKVKHVKRQVCEAERFSAITTTSSCFYRHIMHWHTAPRCSEEYRYLKRIKHFYNKNVLQSSDKACKAFWLSRKFAQFSYFAVIIL